MDINQR